MAKWGHVDRRCVARGVKVYALLRMPWTRKRRRAGVSEFWAQSTSSEPMSGGGRGAE
jgi:hypothetical protein